ncbi:MAG: serine--tRNA ligase [Phycisphaerales bacterium]|jgi:seryl-tRNA synthetase|nr:serine--tRNA ligase [Phycisphaerales bacterium]
MIDIKLIRSDPDKYTKAAADKNMSADIAALLEADSALMDINQKLQDARTAQNNAGKQIAELTGQDKVDAIMSVKSLKTTIAELEAQAEQLTPKFDDLMLLVAQPAAEEVPLGKDDTENLELRTVGEIPSFDFELKDHVELGEALDIIDIPRGVKLAGSRNFILKGAGAMLHQAVLRLAMDQMIAKGYQLMTVPVLVNEDVMYGTGYFPLGRDQAYLAERDNKSLVGTSEVPLTAYHSGEILEASDLPKKYIAVSTCFRREAGAAGKDTRGLYRIHTFDKVEQVVIAPNDQDQSIAYHQEILANSEDVLKALELPYRVVNVCTGDLGQGQVQKFDIETWMPSRDSYGETHSASRFYEFQARRLNIRYRDEDGKVQFCHTLNNTVIASPRIMIPLLELNQNADGSINIPAALRQYMGGLAKIEAPK